MEVSAKSGKNVGEAFAKISEKIKQEVQSNQTAVTKNSVIRIENVDKSSSGCKC